MSFCMDFVPISLGITGLWPAFHNNSWLRFSLMVHIAVLIYIEYLYIVNASCTSCTSYFRFWLISDDWTLFFMSCRSDFTAEWPFLNYTKTLRSVFLLRKHLKYLFTLVPNFLLHFFNSPLSFPIWFLYCKYITHVWPSGKGIAFTIASSGFQFGQCLALHVMFSLQSLW